MSDNAKIKIAVIGASGYTGADLLRLAVCHPDIEIAALVAKTHAGKEMAEVFPHLGAPPLPALISVGEIVWEGIDCVFLGLPHGQSHDLVPAIPEGIKIIDMSADFRLGEQALYARWYGLEHQSPGLLKTAVYGLSEHYREQIRASRLVACPGCYPTAVLLALRPLVEGQLVDGEDLIIDAKSGVSGAGRGGKQNTLFCEAGEGLSPYAIGTHRHLPEIEQELSKAAGKDIMVNFTPHLVPMSRGELVSSYVRLRKGRTSGDLRHALEERYAGETFVHITPHNIIPATQHVRGSNYCLIGVFDDRIEGRAIVISVIDNLVKGSAGQALQNFNIMHGLDEKTGLGQQPLFP